ncbi:CsbD family protein [Roseobacter sp.]|uniref:CsbD family protein n=1 Tax=Roseobacter sp. TaxID=1907202 RepID=UPI0032978B63
MNWDIIKGNWTQAKGALQSQWGDLTDDELEEARGDRAQFLGLIQRRYGLAQDEAERQLDTVITRLKSAA